MAVHPERRSRAITSPDADCVLRGELDMFTAETAGTTARAALVNAGPGLVIDVSAVTFIDCSGLAPLLGLVRDAQAAGGRVTLVGPTAGMRRLLGATGLSGEFDLRPALAARLAL